MSNEEFQKIVLEKLENLEDGQKRLETRQGTLEEGQRRLEAGQDKITEDLRAVIEQTADLTEYRQEMKGEIRDIKVTILRVEKATADNWSDIVNLKSIRYRLHNASNRK